MKIRNKKSRRKVLSVGSALILAVVLTSLLAIIGVLFLMASRVNKIATSAISQTRELDLAVDAVIARIAEELALDVPRVDANGVVLQEYYDYPDEENRWLASLEPYEVGLGAYRWLYLTDLYDVIYDMFPLRRRIDLPVDIAPDYQRPDYVSDSSKLRAADADGDGVADSVWAELPNITSGTGRTIYAAVRVIDNGGMLNVNTGFKFEFDGTQALDEIDGSSQMQINLAALSQRGVTNGTLAQEADVLHAERCYGQLPALLLYQQNVVWRYNEPNGLYTPFDISDELKLRNRYILNYNWITTRIEELWERAYDGGLSMPRNQRHSISDPCDWFWKANNSSWDANQYDYRHIATTYNMDRIIAPDNGIMLNVNTADPNALRDRITTAILDANAGFADVSAAAAQIAANLVDFRDEDEFVTAVNDVDGFPHYGFERPCVYISELVYYEPFVGPRYRSYAIELYKPYFEDGDPCGWELVIIDANLPIPRRTISIDWPAREQFHVIEWEDPCAPFPGSGDSNDSNAPSPPHRARWVEPNAVLGWPVVVAADSYDVYFGTSYWDVNDADNSWSVGSTVYKGNQGPNSYDPSVLDTTTTYFWRIDALNASDTVITTGDTWMFRTKGGGVGEPNAQLDPSWLVGEMVFQAGSRIELQRFVPDTGQYITVDSRVVPAWLVGTGELRSFQRDITRHQCVRHLWDDPVVPSIPTSFETRWSHNIFEHPDANLIQAHPDNVSFVGIGDIGKVFVVDSSRIGPADIEDDLRINLVRADYQQIFNYLTVFDPVNDYIDNDGDGFGIDTDGNNILDPCEIDPDELKIPGRININTAPWYVIAQLPWMTPEIAQAIAYYRHTLQGPFRSVGQLSDVNDIAPFSGPDFSIYYYARADGPYVGDQLGFPDLTPADGAADDLEERDLLFARISNLVTVRSDVFTAYILVRIGPDGPQKRVMAILDRSGVYPDGLGVVTGRVRVRALHPVPDPR